MIQICIVQDEFGFVLDDNGFGGWQIGTMEQVALLRANVSSVPPTICHPPSTVANTFLFWQLLLGNQMTFWCFTPLLKRILDLFLE